MNSPRIRLELAKVALRLVPTLIRDDLLSDPMFLDEYGLENGAVLSFRDVGISVSRTELFNSVRLALTDLAVAEVKDEEGCTWQVRNISNTGELPRLEFSKGDQGFILPDLSVLSHDVKVRLCSLDEMAADVNLPISSWEVWKSILNERELNYLEVDLYLSDIRDTPTEAARSIYNGFSDGFIDISTMIPSSRRYYERLVGIYDGSVNIYEYATRNCSMFITQLSKWKAKDGFLLSLFLSAHSSITNQIDITPLTDQELFETLAFLEKSGDRISQLGAIEVGLRLIATKPEIKPVLARLIQLIFDDNVVQPKSGFKLLSALFLFVDGELSRTKLLADTPPFYRRLAAFSHAALIQRQILKIGVAFDTDNFCEWVIGQSGNGQPYIQNLIDMRLEPRWNPDFASAMQLKADFIGRLNNSIKESGQAFYDKELSDLISAGTLKSLNSPSDLIRIYLPGPLEGNTNTVNTMPIEFEDSIQSQLGGGELGPASFTALVNSALLFTVDTKQAELAAQALKLGNHRLKNVEDKAHLVAILGGLAIVAAVARSNMLAAELRILVRKYRHDPQFSLSIDDSIKICLMSSASYKDLTTWQDYIGNWITEMAFDELSHDDGIVLNYYLRSILLIAPELWISCGKADAAIKAFLGYSTP